MRENDVEQDCVEKVTQFCPGAVVYKHADRWTAGIPDRSVTWRGYDSWLEFKLWDARTTFHDEFATTEGRPNTQLLELMKLERQTGRSWVIAYREANVKKLIKPRLEIYRPSAWVDRDGMVKSFPIGPAEFTPLEYAALHARTRGVAFFDGFDHRAVVSLIHLTHRKEYNP